MRAAKGRALGWWDYWARHPTTGPRALYSWNPANAHPWVVMDEIEREAWVRTMGELARKRARDRLAAEIEAGYWVDMPGFTVADLDAWIKEHYR